MNIINNINVNQHQLLDAILHKVSATGDITSPIEGQIVYVSGTAKGFYYRSNTTWVKLPIAAEVVSLLTATNNSITLGVTNDVDGFKIVNIAIANATNIEAGFMSATDKNTLSSATATPIVGTIIKRSGSGTAQVEAPVNDKDIANKKYVVDQIAAITSGGVLQPPEIYDLTNSSSKNFPSGASAGKTYILTNAGTNGTILGTANQHLVNSNDMLICINGAPASTTNGNDWFIIESNRDLATDLTPGVAKLLKTIIGVGEVLSSNNGEALTPIALTNFTRKFKTTITTTAAVSYLITHGMEKPLEDLVVVMKDSTGNEINVFKAPSDNTSFTIEMRAPVLINQTYYITVTG